LKKEEGRENVAYTLYIIVERICNLLEKDMYLSVLTTYLMFEYISLL
jgi:hypothetical protein